MVNHGANLERSPSLISLNDIFISFLYPFSSSWFRVKILVIRASIALFQALKEMCLAVCRCAIWLPVVAENAVYIFFRFKTPKPDREHFKNTFVCANHMVFKAPGDSEVALWPGVRI